MCALRVLCGHRTSLQTGSALFEEAILVSAFVLYNEAI